MPQLPDSIPDYKRELYEFEKRLAHLQRHLITEFGRADHYGYPELADDVQRAYEWLGVAIETCTRQRSMEGPPVSDRTYL